MILIPRFPIFFIFYLNVQSWQRYAHASVWKIFVYVLYIEYLPTKVAHQSADADVHVVGISSLAGGCKIMVPKE